MAKEKRRRDDPTGADGVYCDTGCIAELLLFCNRNGRCQVLKTLPVDPIGCTRTIWSVSRCKLQRS